jgi:DNA-binding MarR family transcriptional regulator
MYGQSVKHLRQISRRVRQFKHAFPKVPLHPGILILSVISEAQIRGQKLRVSDILYSTPEPPATISRWLSKLIKDGYVQQQRSDIDARVYLVSLPEDVLVRFLDSMEIHPNVMCDS